MLFWRLALKIITRGEVVVRNARLKKYDGISSGVLVVVSLSFISDKADLTSCVVMVNGSISGTCFGEKLGVVPSSLTKKL